jgi:hypothetical protein
MRFEVHGYAIISADDRIADAAGRMPESLKNEADWDYFQSELDRADFVVLGRLSHEATPNARRRRRVVLSRSASGLEPRSDAIWWNPQTLPWNEAAPQLAPGGGRFAVPGGRGPFDLFLRVGYAAFHLSRAPSVLLPGGVALFSACDRGDAAEAALAAAGLVAGEVQRIDAVQGVTLTVWRSPPRRDSSGDP